MGKQNKKSSTSFLVQGSILAIASIVSRIIGLIYRIPLTNIIGDTGNDYYGTAFQIYIIDHFILQSAARSIKTCICKLFTGQKTQCIPHFKMCIDLRCMYRYGRRTDPFVWC